MTEKEKVIFEIQQYIRNIDKSRSNDPSIIPDGIFSEETKEAVKNFQSQNGLPETGTVDYVTFEALKSENRLAVKKSTPPIQITAISDSDLPLISGTENEFVQTLKTMLNTVAKTYENFNFLELNEFFDNQTQEEVTRWQKITFVPQTGEVNKETWNSLASYYLLHK